MNEIKSFILVSSLFLFVACSQKPVSSVDSQVETQNNSINQTVRLLEEIPLERLRSPSKQVKVLDVKDFGIFRVIKNSTEKDERGWNLPPFNDAQIEISLNQEPKIGEKITIVPLKVDLEPFQLSLTQVGEKKEKPCTGIMKKYYWDVELEKITNREILEIKTVEYDNQELPFEVFGIYPSVEFAGEIPQSELTADMLPKGVSIKTVEAAIDLDNDGKPDLLETVFCCSNESIAPNDECEYICQKSFKKIGNRWKLVGSANPC